MENKEQEDHTKAGVIPTKLKGRRSKAGSFRRPKSLIPGQNKADDENSNISLSSFGRVFLRNSSHDVGYLPSSERGFGHSEEYIGTSYIGHLEQHQLHTTNYGGLYIWYTSSPRWRRFTFEILTILCFVLVIQLAALLLSIYWMIDPPNNALPSVCPTERCLRTANWLKATLNTSVDPCDDFYEYVCGNFKIKNQDALHSEVAGEYKLFRSVVSDVSERSVYGEMLRNEDKNPIYQQITTFYKSCMNYSSRNEVGEGPFVKLLQDMGLNLDSGKSPTTSEILYNIWRYTGKTGLFPFKLFVNPYDGYRKILIEDVVSSQNLYISYTRLDRINRLVSPIKDSQWKYAWQVIKRKMKIGNYSVGYLQWASIFVLNYVWLIQGDRKHRHAYYIEPDDVNKTPQNKDTYEQFNCDAISKKLDETFGDFSYDNLNKEYPIPPDRYVPIALSAVNEICNGEVTASLSKDSGLDVNPETPNWTPELSYKMYWIFFLFFEEINNLSPEFSRRLSSTSILFDLTAAHRGDECLRSLKTYMPHLLHERSMQILKVTPEQIEAAKNKYPEIHYQLRKWVYDPKREKTFGKKILALYRQVIDSYQVKLISPRFSIKELEAFGYKETAKKMDPNKYLENIRILGENLGNSERERWRRNKDHYFPVSPFDMSYTLETISRLGYDFRPNPIHLALMPAKLFSDLFSDNHVLALRYGGIWAYIAQMTVNQWLKECDNNGDWREELKEDVDFVKSCTRFNLGAVEDITLYKGRKGYSNNFADYWLDLTFELIYEAFDEERKKTSGKFRYKTLPGLDYTEDQLLFLTLTRHQCAGIQREVRIRDISNPDKMRTGLSRSPTFRKVWNCKPGSRMHSPNKCFFND